MVNELTVLKSIHVLAAAFWVGGGFALNLGMYLAASSGDRGNMLSALRLSHFFGQKVVAALALVVLVTGAWMTEKYYAWDVLWISLGMAGVFIATAIALFYLSPRAARGAAGIEAGKAPPPGRNWVPIVARLNLLIVSAVLVVMVIKPS